MEHRSSSGSSKRILVAVDESEQSMKALAWALHHLAKPSPHTTIDLLHVQMSPDALAIPENLFISMKMEESIKEHQKAVSQAVLDRARAMCEEKQLNVQARVAVGDTRDVICDTVQEVRPTCLVMGSRGYGPVKRTFLGSVSDFCAHHANCPVVIVKEP